MIGLLLITAEAHVREDFERLNVRRTVDLRGVSPLEDAVARRTRGEEGAVVFASPARRWSDVMEALRVAAVNAIGDVRLRFYEPGVLISLKWWTPSLGWSIGPHVDEFDHGAGGGASALARAVRQGVRDLQHDEESARNTAFVERCHAAGLLPKEFA